MDYRTAAHDRIILAAGRDLAIIVRQRGAPPPTPLLNQWWCEGSDGHWVVTDPRPDCPNCPQMPDRSMLDEVRRIVEKIAAQAEMDDPLPSLEELVARRMATTRREWLRHRRNRRARKQSAVCRHGPGCFDRAAARLPAQSCAHCGATDKITADHIIPLAKGGPDCRYNYQPLCGRCNSSKGSQDPLRFAKREGVWFDTPA